MSVLRKTREAIYAEFHDWIPGETKKEKMAVIREATYPGSKDPGQWSPGAAVVIHTESGIPNPSYDMSPGFQVIEGWARISRELGTHFCEPINCAVIGVHRV